jgi:hypothetical protein
MKTHRNDLNRARTDFLRHCFGVFSRSSKETMVVCVGWRKKLHLLLMKIQLGEERKKTMKKVFKKAILS